MSELKKKVVAKKETVKTIKDEEVIVLEAVPGEVEISKTGAENKQNASKTQAKKELNISKKGANVNVNVNDNVNLNEKVNINEKSLKGVLDNKIYKFKFNEKAPNQKPESIKEVTGEFIKIFVKNGYGEIC